MKKIVFGTLCVATALLMTSCFRRPYDKPEYVTVDSNETAFVIPLETNTKDQKSLQTEDYWKKNMVSAKRIRITHRWDQTGRWHNMGRYIATVKVIKIDRTPVSVQWTANSGAQRVSAESKESIGFTVPISLTAMIKESGTPKFLSVYTASKSLKDIVDTDINAYVSAEATKMFSTHTLEECKSMKNQIVDQIADDTKKFFADYGITITQIGTTDGLTYDNKDIQTAIDEQAQLQAEGKALVEKEKNAEKQREIDLKNARNEAQIARTKASSVAALKSLQEVENSKILAQAQADALKIAAQNVKLPDVIPENTFMNLGLDKYVPSASTKK